MKLKCSMCGCGINEDVELRICKFDKKIYCESCIEDLAQVNKEMYIQVNFKKLK